MPQRWRISKTMPLASLVMALFLSTCTHALEISVRGEPASASDIATLNPVCKLIMENKGIHHNVGQVKNAALFDRPEYHMAKGNEHLHHYCWALISKQRYFRAHGNVKRDYYFREFMGDINYVIKYSQKSWPYFDVMLVEQGVMLMIRGDYQASLQKADEALIHKPDSEKAYLLKFDVYKSMGNKKAAIDAANEGLEKIPDSDRLRKRLVSVGAPVPHKHEQEESRPEVNLHLTTKNSEIEETGRDPIPATKNLPTKAEARTLPESNPAPTTQPNRPNCRFCP